MEKKRVFTIEKDQHLFNLVINSKLTWAEISQRFYGRTPRECYARYINYLAPTIHTNT